MLLNPTNVTIFSFFVTPLRQNAQNQIVMLKTPRPCINKRIYCEYVFLDYSIGALQRQNHINSTQDNANLILLNTQALENLGLLALSLFFDSFAIGQKRQKAQQKNPEFLFALPPCGPQCQWRYPRPPVIQVRFEGSWSGLHNASFKLTIWAIYVT